MRGNGQGLTQTYNLFHNPDEENAEIIRLRELHVALDAAVARAYGWDDLELGHAFFETPRGVRFTSSPLAREEILDRLLALNHERYAEEIEEGHHRQSQIRGRRSSSSDGGYDVTSDGQHLQRDLFGST